MKRTPTAAEVARNVAKINATADEAGIGCCLARIARQDRAPHPEEQAAIARRRAEMGRGR